MNIIDIKTILTKRITDDRNIKRSIIRIDTLLHELERMKDLPEVFDLLNVAILCQEKLKGRVDTDWLDNYGC